MAKSGFTLMKMALNVKLAVLLIRRIFEDVVNYIKLIGGVRKQILVGVPLLGRGWGTNFLAGSFLEFR